MTTSWDCFDTLVTRRRFNPLSVFDAMGEELGLSSFTQRRKAAESRAPWTLQSIYEELAKDYGWNDGEREWFMQAEVQAEMKHCCPIVENINKVEDGDLIVSDMYLPADVIEGILRKNGLTKDIKVFVSTGGKSSGSIWSTLPKIDLHIGDNYHSDVVSANNAGIKAKHYTGVHFSSWEEEIGGDLAMLMRLVRLACPYEDGSLLKAMWHEQSSLNIPALVLAALELPKENVTFVHRDCVHLQPIYEALHGTRASTFHCSRIALKKAGEAWLQYVQDNAYGKLIVDLQGTGGSIISYWQGHFQEMPSLCYLTGTLQHGTLLAPCLHDAIERFNSSPLGSLLDFPNRLPCEYPPKVLECQAKAVETAISYFPFFNFESSIEQFQKIVGQMPHSITVKKNVHIDNHEALLS